MNREIKFDPFRGKSLAGFKHPRSLAEWRARVERLHDDNGKPITAFLFDPYDGSPRSPGNIEVDPWMENLIPVGTFTARAKGRSAADVLGEMAETYRERNKVYGENFRMVGPMLALLHPDGVTLKTPEDHELFHLWSLVVVKLTRFATSDLTHVDSIHDAAVYCAMIESILKERAK